MKNISIKDRIIKLIHIFYKETDEINGLGLGDIVGKLKLHYGSDYNVDFRSIKDDINILRDNGIYIEERKVKYGKIIYMQQDRIFETNELRVLIDSISSSNSIGRDDKKIIIDKIKKLTSGNIAKELSNQIYVNSRIINKDKTFRINVDEIHRAIENRNKIEFKYGRYDLNKDFIINENTYRADPYNLAWDNGFYYLVGYDEKKEKIINFRVDRMRSVKKLEEKYPKDRGFNLNQHLETCFNMYPGEMSLIQIKFHNHLINAIIDRFGVGINIEKLDESNFILTTRAAINTGLIRWILNWGSDAKVLSPESLVDDIKIEMKKMYDIYE